MRVVVLVCSLLSTDAAPALLDWFAEPCTGSGEPKPGTDIVGQCFSGGAKVLTISEQASVRVKSYDSATGEGTIKLDFSGMATLHCPPITFKKKAQAINVDAAACFKHNLAAALASVQYCSDQNSVLVHIKVPEEAAPGAKELPHIPVTLKAASCSDAKADMQAAVAKARVA